MNTLLEKLVMLLILFQGVPCLLVCLVELTSLYAQFKTIQNKTNQIKSNQHNVQVLLQSYTVITSMSPRVDPKSNGEVFLNSLRAGVQTGVMKLCDAIVVNIKKLKQ